MRVRAEPIRIGDARESTGLQAWTEELDWDDSIWIPPEVKFIVKAKRGRANDSICQLVTLEGWTIWAWVKHVRLQSKAL